MTAQALSGLKVVEFGEFISAAYCTKMMADMGAEVIKVEEPGRGDEARSYGPFPNDLPHPEKSGLFLYLNSNKRGITLDPKTALGRRIFLELLREADILVENNPPQSMKEMGLDYSKLKKINPSLIMTSITPYGQTGPYKDYKGYDLNAQVLGGLSTVLGSPDREPLTFQPSQGHYQGAISGAAATMVALFARETNGRGQQVDISEMQTMASFQRGAIMPSFKFKGLTGTRNAHRGAIAQWPYGVFPCKDGYFTIMTLEFDHWQTFARAIGSPEWATDPKYTDQFVMAEYADELEAHLISWTIEHTMKEIAEISHKNNLPFQPVNNMEGLASSEQLKAREYFLELDHPEAGRLKYPGAGAKLSKTPWKNDCPAPLLGEHNEEIYCKQLGYSLEELAGLRRVGII